MALPSRYRSAYNTVQTGLERLSDRGLLRRERSGNAFVYRPAVSEAEYLYAVDSPEVACRCVEATYARRPLS